MMTHFNVGQTAKLPFARTIGLGAIAVVLTLATALLYREGASQGIAATAQQQASEAVCGPWDQAASEAIVRLVRGKKDADLRQIADAVFRIRRARRNCEAGWTTLACRDYRAVVRTAPAPADRPPAEILACPPAPSHALR